MSQAVRRDRPDNFGALRCIFSTRGLQFFVPRVRFILRIRPLQVQRGREQEQKGKSSEEGRKGRRESRERARNGQSAETVKKQKEKKRNNEKIDQDTDTQANRHAHRQSKPGNLTQKDKRQQQRQQKRQRLTDKKYETDLLCHRCQGHALEDWRARRACQILCFHLIEAYTHITYIFSNITCTTRVTWLNYFERANDKMTDLLKRPSDS